MGDYLFADSDFISRLSTENRNVFQKIYDEVKYLCKVVTAGSKEARELEKVKKVFEEAYKESAKSGVNVEDGTIKYALMNDVPFEKNTEDILNMTDEEALKNKKQGNFIRVRKDTPSVILENVKDSGDYEVIIRFDALYLATRQDGVLKGNYHNLGKDIMARLPQFIEEPDAIVRMNDNRLNILTTFETPKGNNGIISMEMNTVKDINSKNDKYNLVVTVFSAKDNYTRNNLIKNGKKVEYKKEDLSQVNHQLYEWLATINDKSSKGSISDSTENVKQKGKMSLSAPEKSQKQYGKYNVYGEDVTLEKEDTSLDGVRDDSTNRKSHDVSSDVSNNSIPDETKNVNREDIALVKGKNFDYIFPMIDEAVPISEKQRADMYRENIENLYSLTDADMPSESEEPYYMPDTTSIKEKTLKDISAMGRDILFLTPKERRKLEEVVQKYSNSESVGETEQL